MILGTAFWGISFTYVKVGVVAGSPFVFLFYKFFNSGTFSGNYFLSDSLNLFQKKTLKISFLISIPLLAGTILQTIGLQYTTVSNAAFITGLDVLLIPVLKFLVYKKKIENKVWIACSLALIGLYNIVVKDGLTLNTGDLLIVPVLSGLLFMCFR